MTSLIHLLKPCTVRWRGWLAWIGLTSSVRHKLCPGEVTISINMRMQEPVVKHFLTFYILEYIGKFNNFTNAYYFERM